MQAVIDETEVFSFWQAVWKILAGVVGYFEKTALYTELKYQSSGNKVIVCG